MDFTRTLRRGMSGADVQYIKEQLLLLGSFRAGKTDIKTDVFDRETQCAVRRFQLWHRGAAGEILFPDGVVGQKTWDAIEAAREEQDDDSDDPIGIRIPANIGRQKAAAIKKELAGLSELRQSIVLEALGYATDPDMPGEYPISLYIRGGNLYNSDLKPNVITAERIESGAKKQPEYYDDGRKEMMLDAVEANPAITGADCSGAVVGILRYFGLVEPDFDQTADTLCGDSYSTAVDKSLLSPGDWVGKSEHIGFYVGAGYVAEWMGGAYGCQLSELNARAGWSFTEKAIETQAAFTRYRMPRYY